VARNNFRRSWACLEAESQHFKVFFDENRYLELLGKADCKLVAKEDFLGDEAPTTAVAEHCFKFQTEPPPPAPPPLDVKEKIF
jgi:hypothetical protein